MPSHSTFTTVRSDGGLLPSDLLARVVAGDSGLGGLAPTDYGFAANERLGEAISRLWNDAKTYWEAFKTDQKALGSGETGVTETRDWMLRLLRELGYGRPEFRAAAEEINGRRYPIQHRSGSVPLHILSFQQDIDRPAVTAAGQPRLSPNALLQEYLNASDAALYGIVTNGLRLRLLRDNASITRLASVEFDLEAMFENSVYSDFVLLFLLLHRTRLPQAGHETGACWLEVWRSKAETQGTRALGALRAGVEKAIEAIGNGLLAHPRNEDLRDRLRQGELSTEGFYAELLRLVYRLIFLFVAEERDLLHPDGVRPEMRQRYMDHYSASHLRGVARRFRTDDRHDDLWRSLRVTLDLLAGTRDGLGLVALEGLFAADACPNTDVAMLANNYLAEAVLHLSNVRVDKRVRRVNYRDIGAEELGGVYEGLLESQPRVAVDAPVGQRFELIGSGQRKTTGSYYTPATLVHELIKSALEPVIADRLAAAEVDRDSQERALLDIWVCDAACGSGHFLLAAARRLAGELARLRSQDREPGQHELRLALRDVVRHCIYGVDRNPLAVDLCRLSLWVESQDKGRPLSFLDHHIKLGNSLVGATAELVAEGIPDGAYEPLSADDKAISTGLKKRNKRERDNQLRLFGMDHSAWRSQQAALAQEMLSLTTLPEDVAGDVRRLRASYEAYRQVKVDPARWRMDTWTAAFFWSLTPQAPPPPTTFDLRAGQGGTDGLSRPQQDEVERLRDASCFFHWPLEFPEVFQRGGFDCVLGNPPWERIKLQEQEFFAERDPEIAGASNKAVREKLIKALEASAEGHTLYVEFQAAKRLAESASKFARESGRFPLTAVGDVNLYPLFAEHDRTILNRRGKAGVVIPTGIATDDSTKGFFQELVTSHGLSGLYSFWEIRRVFPGTDSRQSFSLVTLSAYPVDQADLVFHLTSTAQLGDDRRRFQLSSEDFALLNPNTRTCPIFRTRVDADLTRAIYRRVPVLVNERAHLDPWGISFATMFHMANDSGLFRKAPGHGLLPLYEAKLFHQFTHRWATYDNGITRDPTALELADPNWRVQPRYWVPAANVVNRLAGRWKRQWLLAFRDIARATDERSAILAVLPPVGVGHKGPLLFTTQDPKLCAALYGNLNALVCDHVVRQKMGGTGLGFFVLKQLPILPPSSYTNGDLDFLVPRVLELTYTAWDLKPFAEDLGCDGPPFRWDEERRALLRADLDAYYAALYGLTRDELRYVLDPQDVYGPDFPGETFRVLRERETKQYGEYRSRRMVLEAWDRLRLEPRNRDRRHDDGPTNKPAAQFENGAISAPTPKHISVGDSDNSRVTAPSAPPPPLTLKQQLAPNRTPASQPTLLRLSSDETSLRSRVLEYALQVITTSAPIKSKDVADRLSAIDVRIDRSLVNSVLYHEGAALVDYDEATGTYLPKQIR